MHYPYFEVYRVARGLAAAVVENGEMEEPARNHCLF